MLLTMGAIVGSLCLVLALAGLLAGVKPLVFRSGSMGPEIPAGALALSRPVAAEGLAVGDVVSVVASDGTQVTHRIVEIAGGDDDSRVLALQGDANGAPDAETYEVTAADRVFWSVPLAGHLVSWAGTPLGLLLLGGFVLAMLVVIFRRPRGGGKRKATGVAAATTAVAVVVATTTGTSAAFTDASVVSGGPVGGGAAVSPTARATTGTDPNCTANNGLLSSSITFRWNGVAPGAQPIPQPSDHEYVLRFFTRSNNAQVGADVVQHSGAAGSVQAVSYGSFTLGELLGLNLLSSTNLRIEIRSHLKGTQWYGAAVVATNFNSFALLGIVNFTCNA